MLQLSLSSLDCFIIIGTMETVLYLTILESNGSTMICSVPLISALQ